MMWTLSEEWLSFTKQPPDLGQGPKGYDYGQIHVRRDKLNVARWRSIFEESPIACVVVGMRGRIVASNRRAQELFAFTSDELEGRSLFELTADYTPQGPKALKILTQLRSGKDVSLDQANMRKSDRTLFASDLKIRPIRNAAGKVVQALTVILDVSATASPELSEAEERFRIVFENANDAIFLMDPFRDQILDVNPKACSMLGYTREELLHKAVSQIHPNEMPAMMAFARRVLDRGAGWTDELTCLTASGRILPAEISASVTRVRGRTCLIALVRDITQRKQAQAQLAHAAFHDPLTGLPNRTLLLDRLQRSIARRKRNPGHGFAVLFLDLDHFKDINDSQGHVAGDDVLRLVAQRLESLTRVTDTVARLGGDEFVILLDDVRNATELHPLLQRIGTGLDQPFSIAGHDLRVSVSIGAVLGAARHVKPENVLREADSAMYAAKTGDATRYRLFRAPHAQRG